MKNLPVTIILLLFSALSLAAQNQLSTTHYKYKNTLRICEQVALTFSDLRQVPKLVMPKGKSNQIARFWPESEIQLTIDEKLYDLCREMGKDSLSALAFIISHELTHFFYNHQHPFGFANSPNHPNKPNSEIEMQADLYGLINAFAAGYQSFKVAKPILEKIYRVYQLDDNMMGYPTKTERLKSIEQYAKQAQGLASAFEAGEFLYLKKEYAAAEHCFKHVARTIPAKEILNNLGLTQLQQVLSSEQISTQQMPFKMPVELEAENRLMGIRGERNPEKNKAVDIEKLIKESIRNFEKAIELDKGYSTAYINLATARILLTNYGTTRDILDQLRKNTQTLSPDVYLLRAINHLYYKEYEAAQADLDHADGAFEIEYNRKVASWIKKGISEEALKDSVGKYISKPSKISRSEPLGIEKSIGSLTLSMASNLPIDYEQNLPQPNVVHIRYSVLREFHAYKIVVKDGTFQVIQNFAQTPDMQTKQGIKIGDTVEAMQLKYGPPSRMVAIGNGHFYCYDEAHIYFRTIEGKIDGWLIYQKII